MSPKKQPAYPRPTIVPIRSNHTQDLQRQKSLQKDIARVRQILHEMRETYKIRRAALRHTKAHQKPPQGAIIEDSGRIA